MSSQTWLELADKIVEEGKSAIAAFAQLVKQKAPQAWFIIVKQVIVDALVPSMAFFAAAGVLMLAFWGVSSIDPATCYATRIVFLWIIGILATISGICGMVALVIGLGVIINPAYAAAEKLLRLIRTKHE